MTNAANRPAAASPVPAAAADGDDPVPAQPRDAQPPRDTRGAVGRRAWADPRVRSWLLLAGVLFVAAVGLFADVYFTLRHDAWLLREGLAVDARVLQVGHDYIEGHGSPAELPRETKIQYEVGGRTYESFKMLPGFDTGWVIVGKPLRIHVSPNDPLDFTARQGGIPLLERSAVALALLPLAPLAFAVAAWKRRRLLRTWRDGELAPAYVIGVTHVAIAPSARAVSCSSTDDRDTRMFRAFLPKTAGRPPAVGDIVWLILPVGGSGAAVAAAWFERHTD